MNSRNGLLAVFLFGSLLAAQESGNGTVTFKSGVNLVTVPVVVRDSAGDMVRDLKQEDFTLLDNDKPARIVSFSVEKPGQRVAVEKPAAEGVPSAPAAEAEAKKTPMVIPDHFVLYLFDDLGFRDFGDLTWSRDGAIRHLAALAPGDRAAVLTTSCLISLEFTSDREKLKEAIAKLQFRPHPLPACQPAGGWNPRTPHAMGTLETIGNDPLSRAVRRMAAMPGQRTIVYVSNGLAAEPLYVEELIRLAVKERVVINTLEAGGLHTFLPGADSNIHGNAAQVTGRIQKQMERSETRQFTLSLLASGTGGVAVQNTNDADAAYRKLGTPELVYVLAFEPAAVDNKMHKLKVELKERRKLNLQARTHYFATAVQATEAEQAVTTPRLSEESPQEAQEMAATINGPEPNQPTATFRAKVNEVTVPVVVRDGSGRAVSDLRKDDFTLFDNGKPVTIGSFRLEKPGETVATEKPVEGTAKSTAAPMVIPDHFVAYFFDDMVLGDLNDLAWVRDGALRHLATLGPGDRAAVFTTSCRTWTDFTNDRAKLRETISKLRHEIRSICSTAQSQQPELIEGGQPVPNSAENAQAALGGTLEGIVQRMSILPGQRSIVFVTTGATWDELAPLQRLIDRAIRARVVIHTLQAQGVHPNLPGADSKLSGSGATVEKAIQQQTAAELKARVGLSAIAYGTGGTFVENTNDADAAYRRLNTPESIYMLGFTPADAGIDGKLHHLKVTVKDPRKLNLQARASYYAATQAEQQSALAATAATPPVESKAEAAEVAETIGADLPQAPLLARAPAPVPAASANAPEMATQDQAVTFKTRVNLVMVPVVVRDSKGQAVGNLKQDDFQLFDKGKRQQISKFTVEKAGGNAVAAKPAAPDENVESAPSDKPAEPPMVAPENFIAYLFDDVHLKFGDLAQVRDAAGRNIDTLRATDRAAIFTTSGQGVLDFTDDRAKLHAALLKLRPRALTGSGVQGCPDVDYYMGDLIENKNDQTALSVATQETIICLSLPPQAASEAPDLAKAAARQAVAEGDHESHVSLITLKEIVRRISLMPGQRNLILVSPGFLTLESLLPEELDVVETAVRSNVRISSLDARGLYTLDAGGDISKRQYDVNLTRMKSQYYRDEAFTVSSVLAEMAAGTGGTFIQNTNDFDGGFRRLATAPEYVYMIGFAPENLKPDGSYHALKIKLSSADKLNVQARHGYFAPKGKESELAAAKEAIESAVFSREEIHELPVELHTQFFKPSDTEAKLKVLASVDLKLLQFRKDEGRNKNELTVVSALFDNNGNFVTGLEKIVQLRLLDTTMERLKVAPPIKVTSNFDVKPGSYLIRLVVRDAEGHLMATENSAVEIP
jgi:VWFA-related protein